MMRYTKVILAICGCFLGLYLISLGITTKFSSPGMNNFVVIAGVVIGGGSLLFLIKGATK